MRARSTAGLVLLLAVLTLPPVHLLRRDSPPATGAQNWTCLALGVLAGASVASGNLVGALGFTVGAISEGCFG